MSYDAGSIAVLEGLEAVRARPGMYIGSTSAKGMHHLLQEILDNAVDEHLAGYCSHIAVTLHPDLSVSVRDNGRGIPVDLHRKGYPAERIIMTTLHAGGKFDGESYGISGGLHGVGAAVVNALSADLTVEVERDGRRWRDEYRQGEPTLKLKPGELLPTVGESTGTGTTVRFLPDPAIFGAAEWQPDLIRTRLWEIACLNPDLTLTFTDELRGGETERYRAILSDDAALRKCMIDELRELRGRYADGRRTELSDKRTEYWFGTAHSQNNCKRLL